MTMNTNDVIKTMNDLIETSRDGEQGFRTCAQGVTSPNLKTLFEAAARRCAEGAAELEAKVRGLGGQPAQGGSVSGSMHRAWTNIKSTITGMNEHAVLAECERGEDTGKHAYEAALKEDLPSGRANDYRAAIPRSKGKSRSRPRSSECRRLTIAHVSSLRSGTAGRAIRSGSSDFKTTSIVNRRSLWTRRSSYLPLPLELCWRLAHRPWHRGIKARASPAA
jgi:uncharacterized protein (TIGR02284 family)